MNFENTETPSPTNEQLSEKESIDIQEPQLEESGTERVEREDEIRKKRQEEADQIQSIKAGIGIPVKEQEQTKIESTRIYEPSPVIENEISETKVVFEKQITPDTKVCLIGDGQGMDTDQFLKMGVSPENISSINYEEGEVKAANEGILKDTEVRMRQGDATNFESLENAGIGELSQELVTLMHVLEVPVIKGEVEKNLVENISKILKPGGELLTTQYKHKFTKDERNIQEEIGIEEITEESLREQFGKNWQEEFKKNYGKDWEPGMRYGEISNVRSKEELTKLFEPYFDIKIEETGSEYVLKMKKRQI